MSNSNNAENCVKACASVGVVGAGAAKTGVFASIGAYLSTAGTSTFAAVSGGVSTASAATLAFLTTPPGMVVGVLVGGTLLVGGICKLVSNNSDGATNNSSKTDGATNNVAVEDAIPYPDITKTSNPRDIDIDHIEQIIRYGHIGGVNFEKIIEKIFSDCFKTGDINLNFSPSIVINGSQSSLYLYFGFIFVFLLALYLLVEHSDVIHFPIA